MGWHLNWRNSQLCMQQLQTQLLASFLTYQTILRWRIIFSDQWVPTFWSLVLSQEFKTRPFSSPYSGPQEAEWLGTRCFSHSWLSSSDSHITSDKVSTKIYQADEETISLWSKLRFILLIWWLCVPYFPGSFFLYYIMVTPFGEMVISELEVRTDRLFPGRRPLWNQRTFEWHLQKGKSGTLCLLAPGWMYIQYGSFFGTNPSPGNWLSFTLV